MDIEEFKDILEERSYDHEYSVEEGCEVFKGLLIVTKYLPNVGIEAAEHDQVFSANLKDLIEAGITPEDVIGLARLGWFEEFGSLTHFV